MYKTWNTSPLPRTVGTLLLEGTGSSARVDPANPWKLVGQEVTAHGCGSVQLRRLPSTRASIVQMYLRFAVGDVLLTSVVRESFASSSMSHSRVKSGAPWC